MKRIKTRLIVTKGNEFIALRTEEIALIYRQDQIVIVVDKNENKYLSPKTLSELENELDERLFFRANRKFIVSINYIKSYKAVDRVKIELNLTLPLCGHQVIVSQESTPRFRKWFHEE